MQDGDTLSLPDAVIGGFRSFNNRPLFRIQSDALTITDADKDQNDVFNTNLGAINVTMAMVIHRVEVQMNVQGLLPSESTYLTIGILSENTGATSAVLQGNDTRTLFRMERDWINRAVTSGKSANIYDAIIKYDLDPWPIWTIAQQLNWLGEAVEAVSAAYPDIITQVNLWYTLEPVTPAMRSRLIERLNLAL